MDQSTHTINHAHIRPKRIRWALYERLQDWKADHFWKAIFKSTFKSTSIQRFLLYKKRKRWRVDRNNFKYYRILKNVRNSVSAVSASGPCGKTILLKCGWIVSGNRVELYTFEGYSGQQQLGLSSDQNQRNRSPPLLVLWSGKWAGSPTSIRAQ